MAELRLLKTISVLVAILALFLLFSSRATADYHYASHQGSNEYPYTDWQTGAWLIQDAIDAASPGDTIFINSGNWHESITLSSDDDSLLSLIGVGMDLTRIYWDGHHQAVVYPGGDKTFFEGIHFDNTNNWPCLYAYYGHEGGLEISDCRLTGYQGIFTWKKVLRIHNCIIENITESGIELYNSEFLEVENCLFNNIGWDAVGMESPYRTGSIKNNIFKNCNGFAADFGRCDSSIFSNNLVLNSSGARGGGSSYSIALNNTIIVNQNSHFDYGFQYLGKGLYVNNIICKAFIAFDMNYESDTTIIHYNNLWQNVYNFNHIYGQVDTAFNVYQYPMFISNDDFHLQAYSPLIDAGDPGIFDVDGSRSDIGCYGGPGGENYEYVDLPPLIPDSLNGIFDGEAFSIVWRYNFESDFNRYLVNRDTIQGFEPIEINIIAEPETSSFVDFNIDEVHNYYYRIAAIDNQGNQSGYSDELSFIQTEIKNETGSELPQITSIRGNYPNPFNSQTVIFYSVADLGPIPAQINIEIYDVLGRKVRDLVHERKRVGIHKATWDGKSDSGDLCPSGVYFARIRQWGADILSKPQKLVLLK